MVTILTKMNLARFQVDKGSNEIMRYAPNPKTCLRLDTGTFHLLSLPLPLRPATAFPMIEEAKDARKAATDAVAT